MNVMDGTIEHLIVAHGLADDWVATNISPSLAEARNELTYVEAD